MNFDQDRSIPLKPRLRGPERETRVGGSPRRSPTRPRAICALLWPAECVCGGIVDRLPWRRRPCRST